MANRDFYEVLAVEHKATAKEIQRAYRKLARKYHPDLNPGDPRTAETFKEISQAYEILGDPKKRKQYDRRGRVEPGRSPFGGEPPFRFGGFDFSDLSGGSFSSLFSDLFAGDRPEDAVPRNGSDRLHPIRIGFLDAYRGLETELELQREVTCGVCSGTGFRTAGGPRTCPSCEGRGKVTRRTGNMRFSVPCVSCRGSGKTPGTPCDACEGKGWRPRTERIRIRIPPGVDNESRVRIPGKGNDGKRGGAPGDLFLLIKVDPHPFFRRLGNNLYCEVPISFPEAALGTKLEVPTVEGTARIRVPPGTQSGQKIRLRGKGFPSLRHGAPGNQFVEIRVVTPKIRDERSKEILRELDHLNPGNPRSDSAGARGSGGS
ncbi:MAG: J domain-containing protein [Acidobacteriota bacterium]